MAVGDRVLVTGANGFVGSALCHRLSQIGCLVRKAVRDQSKLPQEQRAQCRDVEWVVLHDQSTEFETQQALQGVQAVIHLAARVHVLTDRATDPLREYCRVNADWTTRLAQAAVGQGVRRFVYMSSVKVHGEESRGPLTEEDSPNTQDPYGASKWKAEQTLARVVAGTKMELTVVRSPLVYGPDVGGNFFALMNVLYRGVPMPLALADNRRSLIYRGNLVDALIQCLRDARAAGRTYLVSDGEDLSTPELIRRLARALRLSSRLWPVPLPVLRWLGWIVGKETMIDRLIGSLQVDSSRIRRELNWSPPYVVDQGLEATAAWFRGRTTRRDVVS